MDREKLQEYCDKFIEHSLKYANKVNKQIEFERTAFQHGIISKQNFENLKSTRQNTIFLYNSLAFKLKMACQNDNYTKKCYQRLYEIISKLMSSCEKMEL